MADKQLQEVASKGHSFTSAQFLQVLPSHAASESLGARQRTQRPEGAPADSKALLLQQVKGKSVGTRTEDKRPRPLPPRTTALEKGAASPPGSSTPPGGTQGQRKSDRTEPGLPVQRGGSRSSPGRRPCHSAHSRVRSASARRKRSSCTTSASSAQSTSNQNSSSQLIAPCSKGGR